MPTPSSPPYDPSQQSYSPFPSSSYPEDRPFTPRRLAVIVAVLSVLCVLSGVSAYLVARAFGGGSRIDSQQTNVVTDADRADAAAASIKTGSADAAPAKIDAGPTVDAAVDADTKIAPLDGSIVDAGGEAGEEMDGGDASSDAAVAAEGDFIELHLRVRPVSAKVKLGGDEVDHTKVIKLKRSREVVRLVATADGYYRRVVVIRPTRDRRATIRLYRKRRRSPTRSKRSRRSRRSKR